MNRLTEHLIKHHTEMAKLHRKLARYQTENEAADLHKAIAEHCESMVDELDGGARKTSEAEFAKMLEGV